MEEAGTRGRELTCNAIRPWSLPRLQHLNDMAKSTGFISDRRPEHQKTLAGGVLLRSFSRPRGKLVCRSKLAAINRHYIVQLTPDKVLQSPWELTMQARVNRTARHPMLVYCVFCANCSFVTSTIATRAHPHAPKARTCSGFGLLPALIGSALSLAKLRNLETRARNGNASTSKTCTLHATHPPKSDRK